MADVYDLQGVETWLAHTWYHCSGSYLFNTKSAGLEIDPDGKWYYLDDVGGKLVRRSGFGAGGTWSASDASSMNGANNPMSVQVNFDSYKGGGNGGFVHFATNPLKLELSVYPGTTSEYLAVQP